MTPTLSSRLDPERSARLRALLVDTVERTTAPAPAAGSRPAPPVPARRRRVRRPVTLGVITAGALALGTGAAVSVTQFLQPDSLTFVCVLGEEADAEQVEKRATVADAVTACEREWPGDVAVPELAVFMNRYAVFVAPTAWDGSGQDAERVSEDVAFDPRPARLQAALDDWIDGLESECLSEDEAVTRVQDDLAGLGLAGWTVRLEDNGGRETADGVRTCAWAMIPGPGDAPERQVWVRGHDPDVTPAASSVARDDSTGEAELRAAYTQEYRDAVASGAEFGQSESQWVTESVEITMSVRAQLRQLRAAFDTGRCLSVDQAEQEVGRILDPEWEPIVDVSVDETLDCASVEVGMGGTWLVSIVGPETP